MNRKAIHMAVFNDTPKTTVRFTYPTQKIPVVQFAAKEAEEPPTILPVPVSFIPSDVLDNHIIGIEVETQNLNGFLTILF